METIKIQTVLVLMCFIFCNFTSRMNAQENDLYRSAMEKALNKLDGAQSATDISQCRNQFERIAQKFTDKWQPLYYTAYCDIQMVYMDSKSDLNNARLESAKQLLGQLDQHKDADKSEVSTLWGYYYNAMIVVNPATSQTLYANVIASYEKATALNPENPRPVVFRAFFNQFLPSIVKLKIDPKEEIAKATRLFENEEKSIDKPYWGEYYIKMIKVEE